MKPARKDMPAARGEVVTPRFRRWFANGLGNRKGSAFPQTDGIGLQAVSEVTHTSWPLCPQQRPGQ